MSNIGKIRLDFVPFDSWDPKLLVIGDFSKWKVIEDMPAYIDIIMPGSRKDITLPFQKHSLQTYSSLSLGLNSSKKCDDPKDYYMPLPDGIWEFCLRGGENGKHTKKKYYLKKDRLQEELDKAWINSGIEYNKFEKDTRDELLYVEGYLRASEAYTRQGYIKEARDMFSLCQKTLMKFVECKNCL